MNTRLDSEGLWQQEETGSGGKLLATMGAGHKRGPYVIEGQTTGNSPNLAHPDLLRRGFVVKNVESAVTHSNYSRV